MCTFPHPVFCKACSLFQNTLKYLLMEMFTVWMISGPFIIKLMNSATHWRVCSPGDLASAMMIIFGKVIAVPTSAYEVLTKIWIESTEPKI